MKNINKIFTLMAATALTVSLTGCIKETQPESNYAIESQMSGAGLDAFVNGMSAQYSQGYLVYGEQDDEKDMAYPQLMIAQTEMLGDMYPAGGSGYDWYMNYNCFNRNYGSTSNYAYLPWRTLYMFVKSANDAIDTYKKMGNTSQDNMNSAAAAYGYRAFAYYMLMVLFEPKANIYTDCSSVLGLTVPIVTDETTEDVAKNNPRVSHDEMMKFIISDLDKAQNIFTETKHEAGASSSPTLQVIYGLKAKTYLWDEKYDSAYVYATKAIDLATTKTQNRTPAEPMTQDELTNKNSAFTTATSGWMWYTTYSAENMGNLCNFTGWMSGEADWGYSSLTNPAIDASLYKKMTRNDYRRQQFLDPSRQSGDYATSRTQSWLMSMPDYLALKFRCKTGDYQNYATGGAVDVPIMRIEEMYLIQAEADAVVNGLAAGIKDLNSFMTKYRDPSYSCAAENLRAFQLAVLDQMRIEFWGEGNAFPSAKRLQPGVMQNYEGTNAPEDIFLLNCKGMKPNWNLVIPNSEVQSNPAIEGHNNPDPTKAVTAPSPKGEYSPANN